MPIVGDISNQVMKVIPNKKILEYLGDVADVKWVILMVVVVSFVVGFLYMIIIRYTAACMVWAIIISWYIILIFLCVVLY